ncbi:MAG: tetraacyldisaccharide 4'-kinase [Candidatus Glassbacteria bacterium]
MAEPYNRGLFRPLKWWLVGLAGSLLVRLVYLTIRTTRYGLENLDQARQLGSGPVIFAAWHGRLLGHCYNDRKLGACALISRHTDGEIIARIVERLGFLTARGSSTRGAAPALKAMLRALGSGRDLALTVDGPIGPPRVAKPGAVYAAARSGCPLVPVSVGYSRCWQFASWDSFQFPRPFCRMTVGYGEPIVVPGEVDESTGTQWSARLGEAIDRMAALCDDLARPPLFDRRPALSRFAAGFLRRRSDFSPYLPLVILLFPLELVYRLLWWFRDRLYAADLVKSFPPSVPTVCAGSLFAGGAGKTPLSVELARRLAARGLAPAVISRGYRAKAGRREVPLIIPPGEVSGESLARLARSAGDEPALIARSLPEVAVVVSADRVRAARAAVERTGARALVLDDGFGHRRLGRHLDLLGSTPALLEATGHLLPAGYLREPGRAARRAAGLVVIRDRPGAGRIKLPRWAVSLEVIYLRRRVTGLARLDGWLGDAGPGETVAGRRLLAFCGIADPEAFRETLVRLGPGRVDLAVFGDHHPYSEADQLNLAAAARELKAHLVTTEKDAVKLDPRLVGADCLVLCLDLEEEEPGSLDRLLDRLPGPPEKP